MNRAMAAGAGLIGIGALAIREPLMAEGVFPADIIPVIDMIGQSHHVAALGEAGQQRVGGGALRAALAGEQFHHRLGLGRRRFSTGRPRQSKGQGRAGNEGKGEAGGHGKVLSRGSGACLVKSG